MLFGENWFWIEFTAFHLLGVPGDTVDLFQEEHCWKRWIIFLLDGLDHFLVLL